jgi:ankyrin repeat protein
VDYQWNLPLIYAAATGSDASVRALLSAGADPAGLHPARPADVAAAAWPALHVAAAGGHAAAVVALLAGGADARRAGPDGRTALDMAEGGGEAAAAAAAALRGHLGLPAPGAVVRVSHILVKHGKAYCPLSPSLPG